jgi:hypothetical protein
MVYHVMDDDPAPNNVSGHTNRGQAAEPQSLGLSSAVGCFSPPFPVRMTLHSGDILSSTLQPDCKRFGLLFESIWQVNSRQFTSIHS